MCKQRWLSYTRCIASADSKQGGPPPGHRKRRRWRSWACKHHTSTVPCNHRLNYPDRLDRGSGCLRILRRHSRCSTTESLAQSQKSSEPTYPINSIKKGVKEAIRLNLPTCIVRVICLIERNGLRIDNWIRELKVQIRLRTSISNRNGRWCSIDKCRLRVCPLRDVRSEVTEKEIQIFLGVVVSFFEDSKRVAGADVAACMRDLVQSGNTSRSNDLVASTERRRVNWCLLQGLVLFSVLGRWPLGG